MSPYLRFASSVSGLCLLAALAAPASAQDSAAPASQPDQPHAHAVTGDYHAQEAPDIVVTGVVPRNRIDILSGTSVVSGNELTRDLRSTIGETLARQPGVSSTSFGPNASRPVLRGFQGDRVRILTDGIGSFDASGTSVDHAVVINTLTAERIEVLRGPASLLYGSSAIGGVVNVIDSRIPRRVPDEAIHIEGIATYGSAADERNGSGKIEVPLGDRFVVHLDGSYAKSDDLRTGGHILSPAARATALASGDADIAALADLGPDLPNSAARTWEVAGGAAFIDSGGNLGISFAHYDNLYGVPARFALEPGGETEMVRIAMKQNRADLRGEIGVHGPWLDTIRVRAGWADYQHSEIEDTGAVGTTFYNQGLESRLELVQSRRGGWDGAVGAQLLIRDFEVVGDEKFLPKNETTQFGLFTLQSVDMGDVRVEGGARYEHTQVSAVPDADLMNPAYDRHFSTVSGSLGASYTIAPDWRIGLNGSRAERAPTAEELFARGNHAGTQAFELGNPNFGKEKSWGLEGSLRGGGAGYALSVATYYNWFDGFIYDGIVADSVCQTVNGGAALDFPCFQNFQGKARQYGFEVEGSATLADFGDYKLSADAQADYVHATVLNNGPVPRIPPLRVMGGFDLKSDRLSGRIETEHSFAQNRVSANETTTDGFTLVNASVNWKPFSGNAGTSITLSANNIFDVVARRSASFLKDFAPLAGRDIRVTARVAI